MSINKKINIENFDENNSNLNLDPFQKKDLSTLSKEYLNIKQQLPNQKLNIGTKDLKDLFALYTEKIMNKSPAQSNAAHNYKTAIQYIQELINRLESNTLTFENFLYEIQLVQINFKTYFGNKYFETIDKYIADLDGSTEDENRRYYRDIMSREEQKNIIIKNIKKFCIENLSFLDRII